MEAYLEDFRREFWKSIRQPKFVMELLGFVTLIAYACYTGAMYYANRASANAAQSAASTANRTMKLDERAWVSVEVTAGPAKAGEPFKNTAIFSNSGRSYALNVMACKVTDETSNDPPVNPVKEPASFYDCSKESDWHPHGVLAPNSRTEVDLDSAYIVGKDGRQLPFDKFAADYYNAGKYVIWKYGEVRYDDIFGCHHWVRYCYDRPPSSDGGPAKFVTCNNPARNAADTDCQ